MMLSAVSGHGEVGHTFDNQDVQILHAAQSV